MRLTQTRIVGGLLGTAGFALSYLIEILIPGRFPADPLPVALAFSGLRQILSSGFLYFDWRSPLLHLLYAAVLGLLSALLLEILPSTDLNPPNARQAGRFAAGVSVLLVALMEVDSVMVAVFYVGAGLVSVWAAALVAERTAIYWQKRDSLTL